MKNCGFIAIIFMCLQAFAQVPGTVNTLEDERNLRHAFVNVTLHPSAGEVLEGITLLVYEGKIEAFGKNVAIGPGTVVHDVKGRHIYPAFIELWTDYGLQKNTFREKTRRTNQFGRTEAGPFYPNMAIHPEVSAASDFQVNEKAAKSLAAAGYAIAFTHKADGIARGTGAIVNLLPEAEDAVLMVEKAARVYSFRKGSSQQDYPASKMGAMALIRQSFADKIWYTKGGKEKARNLSLEAMIEQDNLPLLFESESWQDNLRAFELFGEQNLRPIIKSAGDEYQRIDVFKTQNASFIVPLKFPEGWEMTDPYMIDFIALENLKHWQTAPSNPFLLQQNGIEFSFTTHGLKQTDELFEQLRVVHRHGLSSKEILRALTETPAKQLRIFDVAGSIAIGKQAHFFVSSDTLLHPDFQIFETWIYGKRAFANPAAGMLDLNGSYMFEMENLSNVMLEVRPNGKLSKAEMRLGDKKFPLEWKQANEQVSFRLKEPLDGYPAIFHGFTEKRDSMWVLSGEAKDSTGKVVLWKAKMISLYKDSLVKDSLPALTPFEARFPFAAYGWDSLPRQKAVWFRNATVWTAEKEGILKNHDVLVHAGKIVGIGMNLDVNRLLPKGTPLDTVDARGKHISPGIIDEHSHIAVQGGVNEGTESVTSEVRIGDVVDAQDPTIYYQLAGGVTTSQLLHGSANPIGGQSALIKLKWGLTAKEMKIPNAPGHIKFALGENVKQSNWGESYVKRFPQTRMGVEQVFYDAFLRAKTYQKEKEAATKRSPKGAAQQAFRVDYELEALVEILEGKRHITCHSYIQSEINMLIHVADSMGFAINTFTHILEGYKVAEQMKARGIHASTFSDWWAYKFEVNDAIPYNGALLHEVGVVTGFNSDDAEMGRRLNQEAAKAVLYGGVSEEDAIKFVTIHPAKMLRLDQQTGSIKPGKDADLVLWSDNPLSIYARAELTMIEGVVYFDLELDEKKQERDRLEKFKIAEKMSRTPSKKRKDIPPRRPRYHCDDLTEEGDSHE